MTRWSPRRRLLIALAALALSLAPAPAPARAADAGAQIGLRPVRYDPARPATQSYFIYDAAPGETVRDEVLVRNSGDTPATVRLYVTDGATGQTSGAVYLADDAPRRDVGAWATPDTAELTLGPGEDRVVPFAVAIPADAAPGQHLGGLVAEDTATTPSGGDSPLHLIVQRRTVVAIQVTLPGARAERLTIGGVTPGGERGQQALLLDLRNDGSELVKAAGTLTVTDAGGQEVQRLALTLDTLVPRTAIAYPVYVERQALGPGRYHAAVHLTYGERGVTDYQGDFTIAAAQVAQVFGGRQAPAPPPAAPGAASWITARRRPPPPERRPGSPRAAPRRWWRSPCCCSPRWPGSPASGGGIARPKLDARPAVANELLFVNRYGDPISERGVQKLLTKYARLAGVRKDVTPHVLRHTFASHKADEGINAYQLQVWLGHASVATTQIYVSLSKANSRQLMEKTSL